jgi:hypothetical protein
MDRRNFLGVSGGLAAGLFLGPNQSRAGEANYDLEWDHYYIDSPCRWIRQVISEQRKPRGWMSCPIFPITGYAPTSERYQYKIDRVIWDKLDKRKDELLKWRKLNRQFMGQKIIFYSPTFYAPFQVNGMLQFGTKYFGLCTLGKAQHMEKWAPVDTYRHPDDVRP